MRPVDPSPSRMDPRMETAEVESIDPMEDSSILSNGLHHPINLQMVVYNPPGNPSLEDTPGNAP